jgi:hypothetical protein
MKVISVAASSFRSGVKEMPRLTSKSHPTRRRLKALDAARLWYTLKKSLFDLSIFTSGRILLLHLPVLLDNPTNPSTAPHQPLIAISKMASYLTGSEAFNREKQTSDTNTSTAAWADKYRGVRLSTIIQQTTKLTQHRQQLKTSTLPRRFQSPPMTQFPQP